MGGEVAERFLYLEGVRAWSLAFGRYDGDLYYSIRTHERRVTADRDIIGAARRLGGGHGSMAGARLPARDLGPRALTRLSEAVLEEFLEAVRSRESTAWCRRAAGRPPPTPPG